MDDDIEAPKCNPVDIINGVMRDWTALTAQLLVDQAGFQMALDAGKQLMHHAGMAMVMNVKALTSVGDGHFTAGYSGHMALRCMGMDIHTDLRKDGTISIVRSCPFPAPSPVLCINHFIHAATGFCIMTAQDCSAMMPSCIANGDPTCTWIIKKNDVPMEVLFEEETLAEMIEPPLSRQEMVLWTFSYFSEWWLFYVRGLVEYLGEDEAVTTARKMVEQFAPQVLEKLKGDLPGHNALYDGLAALNLVDEGMHRASSKVDIGKDRIVKEISKCPFGDAPLAACRLHEAFNQALCSSIDPSLEFSYDIMRTKGDAHCRWTLRKKTALEEEGEAKASKEEVEKMLTALKWRLVKGEISKGEYEELRKLALE